jgi:hypothetical protein
MPVYCTLLEADPRERVAELESTIGRKIVEVRELDDGYALRFPPEAGIVQELGRLIDFERICCAFLNFSLRVKAAGGPIWLELTGSDEAKNFPASNRRALDSQECAEGDLRLARLAGVQYRLRRVESSLDSAPGSNFTFAN